MKPEEISKVANRIREGLLDDLAGVSRPETSRGVRVRGAVRTRGGGANTQAEAPPAFVLVEVPQGAEKPSYEEIRGKLRDQRENPDRPLDIYYLVRGKHWGARGHRELDPDNEDDRLLIDQLQPCVRIV